MKQYPTMITAHAGAENTVDNTLESIYELSECGADALEVDVRMQGGILLLYHDVPCAGKQYATLEEALQVVAPYENLMINVDLKEEGLIRPVSELAERCGMTGRYLFTGSVRNSEFEYVRKYGLKVWYNGALLTAEEQKDPIQNVMNKGFDVLNTSYKTVDATLLSESAKQLSVWTVNQAEEIEVYLRAGVRNITTRTPVQALQLRREIQKEYSCSV